MREDRGVAKSRWGAVKCVAVSCVVAAMLIGCFADGLGWNVVFDPTAPHGGSFYPSGVVTAAPDVVGWIGGDGASTVALPPRGGFNRTLWLHGDSMARWSGGGFNFPSNTIAVTEVPTTAPRGTPPEQNRRHFYARTANGGAVDVNVSPGASSKPYFAQNGSEPDFRTWPGDGIVLDGTLFVFMHQWFHPLQADGGPFGTFVYQVATPQNDPLTWSPQKNEMLFGSPPTSPIQSLRIEWGNAVIVDPSNEHRALIFGVADQAVPRSLYVARATATTITSYTSWEFLRPDGSWSAGVPLGLSALKKVAQVYETAELSIDQVTLIDGNGVQRTRFVMVHGDRATNSFVVQISKSNTDPTVWEMYNPSAASKYWWRGSVQAFDPVCLTSLPPNSGCGAFTRPEIWAQKAAWDLSPEPTATSAPLLVSYYGGLLDYSKDSTDNRHYLSCALSLSGLVGSLRFTAIDLMQLRPWCTQATCWN